MTANALKNNYNAAIVSEATMLPLKDKSVDMAVAIDMLHHLPTQEMQEDAVKELLRVSRKRVIFEIKTDDALSGVRRLAYKVLKKLKRVEDIKKTSLKGIVYQKTDVNKMIKLLKSYGKKPKVKRVSYLVDWRIIIC